MRGMPVDDEVRVLRVRVHARGRGHQPAGRIGHELGQMVAHPRALVLADLAANRLRRRGLLKHLVKGDLETLSREVGEPVRVDVTNRPPIDRQPFEFLQPPARLEPIQNHPLDPNGESKIRQHLSGPGPGRNDQAVPLVGSAGRSHADTVAPGGPRRHGLVEVEVGPMTAGQIGMRGHTLLGHEDPRL